MAIVTSVAKVAGRLQVSSTDEGIVSAISSAIAGSTPALESVLQTSFTKGTITDVFYLPEGCAHPVNGFIYLILSKGFLTASAINCKSGDTYDEAVSGTTIPYIRRDAERGHVLLAEEYIGKFVSVTYSYGFADDEEGITCDAKVPEWLQEAGLVYAVKMMSMQQIGDPKPELSEVFKFVGQHGTTVLDAHLRGKSGGIRPV